MIPAEKNIPDQKLLKALDSLKISLFTMNNTSKICSHIVNFIKENFEAESVKIFVLNEESAGFFPYDQPTDESSKFTLFNLFILWMADHDGIYSITFYVHTESMRELFLENDFFFFEVHDVKRLNGIHANANANSLRQMWRKREDNGS